jgi:flagellar hook-length control protein FliK
MSRVSLDALGWLPRESAIPLTSLLGADLPGRGSFDQHLEQARKFAVDSRDARPEPPPDGASPRPTESPAEERRQQSPYENSARPPRSESSDADSKPPPGAEQHAESPSSQSALEDSQDAGSGRQQEGSVDDERDTEKDRDDASDAAAAGAAVPAAQAAADRAGKARRLGGGVKSAALGDSDPASGKPVATEAAVKQPAGKGENAAADPASAVAQTSEPGPASLAAVDGVLDAGGEVSRTENGGDAPNGKTAVLAAEVLASSGGASVAAAGNEPAANAQTKPVDAAAQVVSAASALRQENAAEGRASGSGGRRTGLRPSERIAGEPQTAEKGLQPATADEDAPLDAAVRPAGSGPAETVLAAAGNEPKAQTSHGPTNPPNDARAADPAAAGNVRTSASDAAGRQNEEAAKSDAADRARFVQRVAQAFESAADRAGHVRLRLYPPELGSLRLDLTVRNGLMNARLETETESARNMLLQELPALKERLAEHQIKVESFDIRWQGQAQGGLSQHPGDQTRWQAPSAGHVPGTPGGARGGSGTETTAAPRRLSPGTSFDVVI